MRFNLRKESPQLWSDRQQLLKCFHISNSERVVRTSTNGWNKLSRELRFIYLLNRESVI